MGVTGPPKVLAHGIVEIAWCARYDKMKNIAATIEDGRK
jgi:hypothetical protein